MISDWRCKLKATKKNKLTSLSWVPLWPY